MACSICRMISSLISLALMAAGAYIAWLYLGEPSLDEAKDTAQDVVDKIKEIDFGDLTGVLENFTGFTPDLWDQDPFVGDNSTNVWRGHTSGSGGLSLQLLNALDESWQAEYVEAFDDWNNWCDVKVLSLTNEDVEVDNKCTHVDGVMKVCNGNYGDTGWLGINEIIKTQGRGIIQSSIAKMNEHYLLNADFDERLYTMCHELGHGYGLPHTDENFNNKDLGDCLDYTNTPKNNLRPGIANCNRLLGMYGSVDGTITASDMNIDTNRVANSEIDIDNQNRRRTRQEQRSLRYRSDAEWYEDFGSDEYDEEFLYDDAKYFYDYGRSQYPNMTTEYDEAMQELYYQIETGSIMQYEEEDVDVPIDASEQRGRDKWRRLREHSRGADFSRRLNAGFEIEVHVLYARNRNN